MEVQLPMNSKKDKRRGETEVGEREE